MLTVREVASQCNVSEGTVRNAIARGELAAVRAGTGRRSIRIPAVAVYMWLKPAAPLQTEGEADDGPG